MQRLAKALPSLFESDETAWLEAMSDLIQRGSYEELDYQHLAEYLADMAKRDRREVESRLVVLIHHVLKWMHQPEMRSGSWRATIVTQRQDLELLIGRGVLRKHAEAVLANCYRKAVERAAAETDLPASTFPKKCRYGLELFL